MHAQVRHLLNALDNELVGRAVATFSPGGDIQKLHPMHQAQLLNMIAQLVSDDPQNELVMFVLLSEAQRLDPGGGPYLNGGLLSTARTPEERYSMLLSVTAPALEADEHSLASLAMVTALVIECPEKDPQFFLHLGDIYIKRRLDRESARYQYEQAVAHGCDEALLHLAGLALERGEQDESLALVERALTAKTLDLDSYCDAFVRLEFWHAALAVLRYLDGQGEFDCSGRLGEIYARMGRFEDAIRVYEAAIAEGQTVHYHNLGATYERLEDRARAVECFERGLEQGVPESALALAQHELKRGEPELSARRLVTFIELNREDVERVHLELDARIRRPFIDALRSAIRRAPRRATLRLALVDTLETCGESEAATKEVTLLVKNCGLSHAPRLLTAFVDQGRTRAAKNLCTKILEDPDLPGRVLAHAHATLAYIENTRKKPDDAVIDSHIDRAAQSHGGGVDGVTALAMGKRLRDDGARRVGSFVEHRLTRGERARDMLRALLESFGRV